MREAPGVAAAARWRVAVAGIAVESSTFSPHRTGLADFVVRRGQELLAQYPWIEPITVSGTTRGVVAADSQGANSRATWATGVCWVPTLRARALPGGPVRTADYDALEQELLALLGAAGPLDGVLLDLHGAMSVLGRRDAEGGLAAAVRRVVGPDVLVSASMDLHGNVSREFAACVDLLTCYRRAPHTDVAESTERAARNLLRRLRHGGRPKKAWVQVPVLLPGERTSTRQEPARSIYARVADIEARPGVLDAAVWVGYAWADEPRCRAAVVVTGDDGAAVVAGATELANAYWDARRDFAFVAPTGTLRECLDAAVAGPGRPFFVSDSGDNPTAGGAGDVTCGLAALLDTPALRAGRLTALHAAILDPDVASVAVAGGVGAVVEVVVGARVDSRAPGPLPVRAEVVGIARDDPDGGDVVALRTGGVTFLVTSRRKQFDRLSSWTAAGVDPREADVVLVKLGYLEPELYDIAADWLLALSPGGVDQDLLRLGHHQLAGPVFPFDDTLADPRLIPELL